MTLFYHNSVFSQQADTEIHTAGPLLKVLLFARFYVIITHDFNKIKRF